MGEKRKSSHPVWGVKLDSRGRIVIPVQVRRQLNVAAGDSVLLIEEDDGFRLR